MGEVDRQLVVFFQWYSDTFMLKIVRKKKWNISYTHVILHPGNKIKIFAICV